MKIVLIASFLFVLTTSVVGADDDPSRAVDPKKLEAVREIPVDAITAYGDPVVADADMDEEVTVAEQKEQYRRGRMAFLFGQYDIAIKYWEPLAVSGYAKAQATLGWIYHTGKGAKKDFEKARYWYTRAAYQSHEIALNNLGVFYEQGLGVGKSYQKAKDYYGAAANLGYGFAQYNLGMLYLTGRGVKKNKNKAIYWLENATYQGVDQARAELKALGREVDIPQHEAVNAKIDSKPKWHKKPDAGEQKPHHNFHQKDNKPAAKAKNTSDKVNQPVSKTQAAPNKSTSEATK